MTASTTRPFSAAPPAAVSNPLSPAVVPVAPRRRWEFDALRGLMLVLMTFTHIPTRLSEPFGQPFGFVSAAEGFVLMSGFMAGLVYTQRQIKRGDADMQRAFFQRALKIYVCQIALLAFLFTVIAAIGIVFDQRAITGLLNFYLGQPSAAFFGSLLLLYSPPLLDILPIYVLFMLASPLILLHAGQQGWTRLLIASIALWLAAQFGFSGWLYENVVLWTGLPVPPSATGSFDVLAWQFIWVLGLWLGAALASGQRVAPPRFPGWMVATAAVIAVAGFAWRHAIGQAPFPGHDGLNLMFDKWHLGPMRVLNFFALVVLLMHYGDWLMRVLPRPHWLEFLGRASLPVFCAHLVIALLALGVLGGDPSRHPYWVDVALLAFTFGTLWGVAAISNQLDERTAAMRARAREKVSAGADRLISRGVRRSPTATAHSPGH